MVMYLQKLIIKIKCPRCGSEKVNMLCKARAPEIFVSVFPPLNVEYYICEDCEKVFYKPIDIQ